MDWWPVPTNEKDKTSFYSHPLTEISKKKLYFYHEIEIFKIKLFLYSPKTKIVVFFIR